MAFNFVDFNVIQSDLGMYITSLNRIITEREGVRNLIMGQYGMKWDKMGRFFGNKDVS
tara:strand:- start:226 stop:399 length:174 start_codon:yes stop_codon:yes gene_type:complete